MISFSLLTINLFYINDFSMVHSQLVNNSSTIRLYLSPSRILSKKVIKNDVIMRGKYIFINISKFNDILTDNPIDY